MNQHKNSSIRLSSISVTAALSLATAAAFIFSYIEALFPLPFPFPGIKLGLANLVIVLVLYERGLISCIIVSLLKNLLMALTFGNLFLFTYSMAGGLLSIVFMWAAKHKTGFSILSVSVIGGISHNLGQFLIASGMFGITALLGYAPILYFSGMITGLMIGIVCYECRKRFISRSNI